MAQENGNGNRQSNGNGIANGHGTTNSPEINLTSIHTLLTHLATSAAPLILTASRTVSNPNIKKNTSDLVTETDHQVEHLLSAALRAAYPTYAFLGEETHVPGFPDLTSAPTFVVDPIDGTLNFVHGYPYVSVSLAFVHEFEPLVGVVLNPFTGQLYSAIAGQGAWLSMVDTASWEVKSTARLPLRQPAEPLHGLQGALVAVEWGNERVGNNWKVKSELFRSLAAGKEEGGAMVASIRSLGSAALNVCAVAEGSIDVYWQGGCWVWDVAAGWVILKEAGGVVVGANPGEWEARVDGRMYLFVRAAPKGKMEVIEEVWGHVKGRLEYTV